MSLRPGLKSGDIHSTGQPDLHQETLSQINKQNQPGVVVLAFNLSTSEQKQADLYEFETNLELSSRTARTVRETLSQNQNKQTYIHTHTHTNKEKDSLPRR
jgi:spore germination protein YaaH